MQVALGGQWQVIPQTWLSMLQVSVSMKRSFITIDVAKILCWICFHPIFP